ncbi:MAG: hypothetical protein HYX88_00170 [Chloroflexi bacterium]|nr:hypothetical protein [Chloroflexota bacterium]
MPRTRLGKWSVGLIVIFFLLFATFQLLVASGQGGGATFFNNLVLTVPIVFAGIAGVLAFLTGIVGIIKSRERSVLVFLAAAMGLFILVFWLGEILSPH